MLAAMIVFFASLAAIIGLFSLRVLEERRGARFAEEARMEADKAALELKEIIVHGRTHLEKLPPEVAHMSMGLVHASALAAAAAARSFERQMHRFADFVSAKRNFERRETKSEFLKQVTEYKGLPDDQVK